MIKTLSELDTNMKILLLPNKSYNTTIWVCLHINAFKQIELLKFKRGQKSPSSLFQTQKKPRSVIVCILNVIITTFSSPYSRGKSKILGTPLGRSVLFCVRMHAYSKPCLNRSISFCNIGIRI